MKEYSVSKADDLSPPVPRVSGCGPLEFCFQRAVFVESVPVPRLETVLVCPLSNGLRVQPLYKLYGSHGLELQSFESYFKHRIPTCIRDV